ncbi:MAG: glycosyltransferase family 2 protein [Clostridia bacterium]|nr:glycosyltransferase family 2 protein [Clostridia bacterium]
MAVSKPFDPQDDSLPLISVIVPVYNVADQLPACLDSVCGQTYRNLEIVVCDDGSTDRSPAICEEYARRDPRIKVIRQENRGVSACRNTGLDASTGAWIAWADGDDELKPDAVETLYRACAENGTAMSMGAYRECHALLGGRLSWARPVPAPKGVYASAAEVQRFFLTKGALLNHLWTKLFRRDLFDHFRFPEGKVYEDIYAIPHLAEAAGSLAVVNRPVYCYKVRKGSLSNGVNMARHMDGIYARWAYADLMRRHHPELVGLAYDSFLLMAATDLGKIEHAGIPNAQKEWDEITGMLDQALPQCALQNAAFKIGAWLYKKNKRIISHTAQFFQWLVQGF